jgi:glycosyltransferase involved in cell wall biosynthesis
MRVLIIVDTYVPARISGALQMHDLAVEFVRQGHRPTVLVPAPELDRAWVIDNLNGVEVLRVKALRTKDVGYVRRAMAELLLPFSLYRGLSRSPLAREPWGGVIWYSPTIFLGPIVHWLKRRGGIRSYLILRDLFPDWAVDAGIMRRGLAYRLFKLVERYQYKVADVIGAQTPGNVPLIEVTAAGGSARIEVLDNWLSEPGDGVRHISLRATVLAGKTIFVYAGNMGPAQGMDCLLELARDMVDRSDAGFLFVGRGSEVGRLREYVVRHDLRHVMFMDEIDSKAIPALLAQCHVGLIALDPRHTTHNIPGKFLTYLRAGLPVLARINAGNDLKQIIEAEGVGYVCVGGAAHQLHQLAANLLNTPGLLTKMAVRGRLLASKRYSSAVAVKQIVAGIDKGGINFSRAGDGH